MPCTSRPTVAKASAGAVEHVPIAVVSGLPTTLQRCRDAGIWVVGLDDAADRSLFDLGDLADEGICLVLGAEGAGLSRLVRERCDLIVSIPMLGKLELAQRVGRGGARHLRGRPSTAQSDRAGSTKAPPGVIAKRESP